MNLKEAVGTDRLENSVDLYYVCMMGKYLKARGVKLSLQDVDVSSFSDTVSVSVYYDFFKYAVENGYITDLDLDLPVFDGDESDLESFIFLESFDDVKPYFYKQYDDKYYIDLYDLGGNYTNIRLFKESIEESALINLTSYFHVCSLFDGKTYELHPKLSSTVRQSPTGVASLFYIANSSISSGILKFKTFGNRDLNSLKYNSWYFLGMEKGLLLEDGFSITEKREKLKDVEYQVGNVVFLYERESTTMSRTPYKLKSSLIAVIREVTDTEVVLEKVPTNQTRLERIKKHEEYSQGVQELFRHDDFEVTTFRESFSLTSLGIDYLMSDSLKEFEELFITSIPRRSKLEMWVEQEGFEVQQVMSLVDAVFWVLKDWDILFDEDLYIQTYFADNQIPLFYQSVLDEYGAF